MAGDDTNNWSLSKQDTLVLKGIAIIAMLCHHLYGCIPSGVEPYSGIASFIGVLGKVCVSIFLFCSGYGLSVQYGQEMATCNGWKDRLKRTIMFVFRRFIKFFANYWFVFFIFVPITVFCFNRPLSVPYGEHSNKLKHLLMDLFCLQGAGSYNITWWFNKLIIILYLLFPILYWCCKKTKIFIVFISIGIASLNYEAYSSYGYVPFVMLYILPFVLGIFLMIMQDSSIKLKCWCDNHKIVCFALAIVLFLLCVIMRDTLTLPNWNGIRMDGFISYSLAMVVLFYPAKNSKGRALLSFLGKHSMNIYMVHTFFIAYWPTSNWMYVDKTARCGVNFITLLIVCLLISITIEFIKEKIGFYKLVNRVICIH